MRQDRQSLQTDPVGYEADFNLYLYVGNDPLNRSDPTGLCDTIANCLTGGTFRNADGTVTVESSVVLRALVPGQVQWDAARTDWANGNQAEAVAHAGLMVAEQVVTVATLGTGSAALQGTRATTTTTTGAVETATARTAEGTTRQSLMRTTSMTPPGTEGAVNAAAARTANVNLPANPLTTATAQVGARDSAQQAAALEGATGAGRRASFWENLGDTIKDWLN